MPILRHPGRGWCHSGGTRRTNVRLALQVFYDEEFVGGFIFWLEDGFLSNMEYWSVIDGEPDRLPELSELQG
ncbi:hypothetical protein EYE40_05355 [Glaciihabitans arcticus]|uniref:Uncharacterized protein n=1 Tax=Glaciihabitans arcticus TaxID=2668039 RepID=A0A4Q9GW23_9MICO|nr:hypothetical protein [Glaciihabitans arcticus]TBN56873.1 hypothetical protein EYE40_05355 [Glaciihabitans arcticus]